MDKVARLAAAIFHAGGAASLHEALAAASGRCGGGRTPSMVRVRRHLEAIEQSEGGASQWDAIRQARLEAIDELVETLAFIDPAGMCYVAGRAAKGHVDGTAPSHIRFIGACDAASIADRLEDQGYPPCPVSALATKLGSLAVVHIEDESLRAEVLLLPRVPAAFASRNLVSGEPTALLEASAYRALIAAIQRDGS